MSCTARGVTCQRRAASAAEMNSMWHPPFTYTDSLPEPHRGIPSLERRLGRDFGKFFRRAPPAGDAEVADYYGFDLSSATRAFYKQMVNTRRIPLTFSPKEPNEESLAAIAEGDAFLASGQSGRFANGHDLIESATA